MKNIHLKREMMAVVTSVPLQVRFFLVNHIVNFHKRYEITVISNLLTQKNLLNILPKEVLTHHISILREISLIADIKTLLQLIIYFYRKKFRVVYSISPKAGILCMFAAWFVCVPIRMHTFTGQVWVTQKGMLKLLLKLIDRITAKLATVVIVDSSSQRNFLIDNHVVTEGKSLVLGDGSISGVDVDRFCMKPSVRKMIRADLDVDDSTIIFLYIGRLKKDKGVFELARAFTNISKERNDLELWFVGPDEENIQDDLKSITLDCNSTALFVPYTTAPEDYFNASDIYCLPSFREGFGSTIIEAAACGIPAIGSNIYGITDAIIDGETGVLVEKGNVDALASAMLSLANDPSIRKKMGESAKQRVLEKFHQQRLSDELMMVIKQQLDHV